MAQVPRSSPCSLFPASRKGYCAQHENHPVPVTCDPSCAGHELSQARRAEEVTQPKAGSQVELWPVFLPTLWDLPSLSWLRLLSCKGQPRFEPRAVNLKYSSLVMATQCPSRRPL